MDITVELKSLVICVFPMWIVVERLIDFDGSHNL